MSQEYVERVKQTKREIESFLDFEKRALAKFGEAPQDERKHSSWVEMTEPIARTISAYQTSIGILEKYFPEIKD